MTDPAPTHTMVPAHHLVPRSTVHFPMWCAVVLTLSVSLFCIASALPVIQSEIAAIRADWCVHHDCSSS